MRWFSLFAPCLMAAPAVVGAQRPRPAVASVASASWVAAQTPACGEVVGRIVRRASDFDASDTRLLPIVHASVAVADSGSAPQARQRGDGSVAVTDTAGVFRLLLPPSRTTVLEVKAIGYEPVLIALDGARYRAAVVEATLGSSGFHVPHRGVSLLASRGILACAP